MDENIKTNPTVPTSNAEQKPSPAFDEDVYAGFYYEDMCMSCQHFIGGVCNREHSTCKYEPF